MLDAIIGILMFSGSFFALVASIGLLRMPDLFMRLSATTKAATLGITLVLVAVALYFNQAGVTGRVIAIIVFVVLTAPVAAHMIARAAYFNGVPLWKGSIYDDLRDKISPKPEKDGKAGPPDAAQ
jgi:multicomponent Na+:H+ antiporter subunit G